MTEPTTPRWEHREHVEDAADRAYADNLGTGYNAIQAALEAAVEAEPVIPVSDLRAWIADAREKDARDGWDQMFLNVLSAMVERYVGGGSR